MTEKITEHNKEVNALFHKVLIEGQHHKLRLEAYLISVEDSIENGKLEGKRREKAEELADSVEWALIAIEEMNVLLTTQSTIQNNLQEIIRLTNA